MKNNFLLVAIVLLGIALRVYAFGSVPIALNRDEAALGYNSYLLLQTGADEYGRSWPISLESFGDWKLSGYSILSMPLIAVFGLSDWSVRLLSLIAGIVALFLMYKIVFELVQSTKYKASFALLGLFLLATNSWHIHFSRMAYEANVALTLFLLSVYLLIQGYKKVSLKWYVASAFSLAITTMVYHAYQVIVPAIAILSIVFFVSKIKTFARPIQTIRLLSVWACIILCISLGMLLYSKFDSSTTTKLAGISILDLTQYRSLVTAIRSPFMDTNAISVRLFSNSAIEFIRQLFQNVLKSVDFNFYFVNGDNHGSHSIPGIGKLYSALLPLLVIGLITIFGKLRLYSGTTSFALLLLLLIANLPAYITWVPAHSTRSFLIVFPLITFILQGVYWIWHHLKKNRVARSVFIASFSLVFLYQIVSMMNIYFLISPIRDAKQWHWYAKEMAQFALGAQSDVATVYIQGNTWSPYIYLLLYGQYDPASVVSEIQRLPADLEGFRYVNQLQNIQFDDIPYQDLLQNEASYAAFFPLSQAPTIFTSDPYQFDTYVAITREGDPETYIMVTNK